MRIFTIDRSDEGKRELQTAYRAAIGLRVLRTDFLMHVMERCPQANATRASLR